MYIRADASLAVVVLVFCATLAPEPPLALAGAAAAFAFFAAGFLIAAGGASPTMYTSEYVLRTTLTHSCECLSHQRSPPRHSAWALPLLALLSLPSAS